MTFLWSGNKLPRMRKCHNCEAAVSEQDVFCPSCDAALLPAGAGEARQGGAATGTAPPDKPKARPRKKAKGKLPTALDIYGERPRADVCQQCQKASVAPGETLCLTCSGAKVTDLSGNLKPVPPPKK